MIRRIGQSPRADITYRMRAGAYAILPLKDRFLLTMQMDGDFEVMLPGGGIDPGESAVRALHREVMEETGWRISAPWRLGAFRRFAYMPDYDLWAEKLCHVYVARPTRQVADPTEPDHVPLVVSGSEAVEMLGNDGDRMFMQRYIG